MRRAKHPDLRMLAVASGSRYSHPMKTASKPATAPRAKPRRQSAAAKRNCLALESFDIPDSAVKKYRTERERRAAFARFAAEFGPKDAGQKRTPPAKTSPRSIAKSIASFSREFMLKPGERGIDAVGALLKTRGRA